MEERTIKQHVLGLFSKAAAGVSVLAFIGGGALRAFYDGTPIKDVDLFFRSNSDWQMACNFFRRDSHLFTEITKPGEERYPTFVREGFPPFNLIGFHFPNSIVQLAVSFDFGCCCMAAELIDYGTVQFVADAGAIEEARSRVLTIQRVQSIGRVITRARKYRNNYGYRVTEQFMSKLPECRKHKSSDRFSPYTEC